MKKVEIKIQGMTGNTCAMDISDELNKLDVKEVIVNPVTNTAILKVEKGVFVKDLKKAVYDAGYTPISVSVEGENDSEEEMILGEKKIMANWTKKLVWAWIFLIPLFILDYFPQIFERVIIEGGYIREASILFSFILIFIVGFGTIRAGLNGFFRFKFSMDSLIMLGTVIAFSTGILSFFFEVENYSMVGGMVMAIFITGKYVEYLAKGRATKEVKKLLQLGAKEATVFREEHEIRIPIEELIVGDIMIVKPGEKIPADGIIVRGSGYVDESMVSGESMPVFKNIRDNVVGATINKEGFLYAQVTKIGKDTFLSNVVRLVEEGSGTKIPLQGIVDKITLIFVPIVLFFSFITFFSWLMWTGFDWGRSIEVAISVLIVACPAAIGLAIPISLIVASSRASRAGILIKKGEAIQTIRDVKTICFDKTGTITKGKLEIGEIYTTPGGSLEYLLLIAASLEKPSGHPLAHAILDKEETKNYFNVNKFEHFKGKGISGIINGKEILIGNEGLFDLYQVDLTRVLDQIQKMQEKGLTVIVVSENRKVLGVLGINDAVKEEAKITIEALKNAGYKTVMLTGDNKDTAKQIAKKVGIDEVYSQLIPEEKMKIVKEFQKQGFVAFVGDGINDAPAIKQANVGITIGNGSDIAIEAGDMVLSNSDLTGVVRAIQISRKTFRKIKQNLFWAFFYNILMLPVAISGNISPVFAQIAMVTGTITVLFNGNRLRNVKI